MKENLELFFENPWLYLFGLILIGSYFFFKKKFENLADKDDIADITREVESVKKEFNEDLEKLKVNLDILKSNKIALINEKKKVIYEFWIHLDNYEGKLDYYLSANVKTDTDRVNYLFDLDKQFDLLRGKSSMFNLVLYDEIDDEIDIIIDEIYEVFFEKEQLVRKTLNSIVELHNTKGKFPSENLLKLYADSTRENNIVYDKFLLLTEKLKKKFIIILKILHAEH